MSTFGIEIKNIRHVQSNIVPFGCHMIVIDNIYIPFERFCLIYQKMSFFKENKPDMLVPSKMSNFRAF